MNATAMNDLNHALEHASAERRRALSENERSLLRPHCGCAARYTATSARKVSVDAGLTAPMVNYFGNKGLYKTLKLVFSALVCEVRQAARVLSASRRSERSLPRMSSSVSAARTA